MSLPLWMRFPWLNSGRVLMSQTLSNHTGHPIPRFQTMAEAGACIAPLRYATEGGLDWWGHPSFVQFEIDTLGVKGSRGDCDTTAMWLAAAALKCPAVDAVRIGAAFWSVEGKQAGHAVCLHRTKGADWSWQSNWHQCAPVPGTWLNGMANSWAGGKLLKACSWRIGFAGADDMLALDDAREDHLQ